MITHTLLLPSVVLSLSGCVKQIVALCMPHKPSGDDNFDDDDDDMMMINLRIVLYAAQASCVCRKRGICGCMDQYSVVSAFASATLHTCQVLPLVGAWGVVE